jgi:nucleoside-diphosphate-sugar epimerase
MSASSERFLVTGALGCIGAWTVRALVREGAAVTTFDLGQDTRRLRLIMSPDELDRVTVRTGDITDLPALTAAMDADGITNVIHLAALQIPMARANPPLGALVNVVGTVNVFEAVKRRAAVVPMAPVVYTSSIGMFGADDADADTGRLTADATAHPLNHYGVYKLANEGNARVYALDEGVSSIGVRPMTVYGAGRDQGMTSGPTKAIVAAVLGQPYTVAFSGLTLYQYAEDVAQILIRASRSGIDGAHVFNLPGVVGDGPAFQRAIDAVIPGAGERITFAPVDLPFPSEIDHDGIEILGPLPLTSIDDGVRATIEIFRRLADADALDPLQQGLEPVALLPAP